MFPAYLFLTSMYISHQNRLLRLKSCLPRSSINCYCSVRTALTTRSTSLIKIGLSASNLAFPAAPSIVIAPSARRSPRACHVFCLHMFVLIFSCHLCVYFFFWLTRMHVSRVSRVCVSFVLFCFSRSYVCILFLLVLT
jgi:hypothetical protein